MSYEVYKAAVLRALPAVTESSLEAPPAERFDLQGQECPHCGNPDAVVQQVEDAEVAKCPQCQCEFSPRLESVTRKVIRQISERRERRMRVLSERLPLHPPVRGLDQTDYSLFRKIVNGEPNNEVDDYLDAVHLRSRSEPQAAQA